MGEQNMPNARKFLEKAAQKLSLPADVAAGVPRLSMNGFSECSLDCHNGILEYEKDEIVISVNTGTVTIRGLGLEVRLMHRDCLTVCGRITGLEFRER